jgi:hypothetical protein
VEKAHRSLFYHLNHPREFTQNLGDLKLGEEYEQWRDHIKIAEGGKRLVITRHLLRRLSQQDPNTAKTLNEKLKNTQK